MHTVGIIAEYNPFHNGHEYHIHEAKRLCGANYAVVVMSGNFVQRGCPAIMDKFLRTQAALAGGADIVFELPVYYATASAEYFAEGAISLLNGLECIDSLCFGSETTDIHALRSIASFLRSEPAEYKKALKDMLKNGRSFPEARAELLAAYNICRLDTERLSSLLSGANSILGIEYLKALEKLKSSIRPIVIQRVQNNYNDESLPDLSIKKSSSESDIDIGLTFISGAHGTFAKDYASATSIRNTIEMYASLKNDELAKRIFDERLRPYLPVKSLKLLSDSFRKTLPITLDMLSPLLNYRLTYLDAASLCEYLDITPDLANRISNGGREPVQISELIARIKSRQYTYTRIERSLLHILLDIRKDKMQKFREERSFPYARLLGFRKSASPLLRKLQKESLSPVITKLGNASRVLNESSMPMFEADIRAGELYRQIVFQNYGMLLPQEYRRGVIISE